ncbi:MAG: hypothetical protein J7L59_00110, partial [Nanoarchaeota archaeon]|nr:hypothetical protein [Nanoarchaeota archaeon]
MNVKRSSQLSLSINIVLLSLALTFFLNPSITGFFVLNNTDVELVESLQEEVEFSANLTCLNLSSQTIQFGKSVVLSSEIEANLDVTNVSFLLISPLGETIELFPEKVGERYEAVLYPKEVGEYKWHRIYVYSDGLGNVFFPNMSFKVK